MKEVIVLMQEQNTTVRKKGQHLTSFERGRIATLHSQGYSNRAIARALNVGLEFLVLESISIPKVLGPF